MVNPPKWGRISRERGFANAARACWQNEKFDIVQSHERIAGCDIFRAGDGVHRRWLLQRARVLPAWRAKLLFASPYHRYVMKAEQEMYHDPHFKQVICNSEMVKKEVMEDFGLSESQITVIYNGIDSEKFHPLPESERLALRQTYQIPAAAKCLVYVGSGLNAKDWRRRLWRSAAMMRICWWSVRIRQKKISTAGSIPGLCGSHPFCGYAETDTAVLSDE